MPPRSAIPSRSTIGISSSPDHRKRCKARSAGEKPMLMPCLAATNPAAQPSAAAVPHSTPIRMPEDRAAAGCVSCSTAKVPAGDLAPADKLGSRLKSNREIKSLTLPGWKAHGEAAQSHHHLCRNRLDPHALDVAASAGDRRRRSPMPRSARPKPAPPSCTCTRAIRRTGGPTRRRRPSRRSSR